MKIIFLGTPEFALPSLQILVDAKYDIVGVFTQPDRPKGRGKMKSEPPVKILAQSYNLPVFQYDRIRNYPGLQALYDLKPDVMITAAFGQILSEEILKIPQLCCINVHGSILPQYRGPAPIQWAIINGEKTTGITTMYTNSGIDTGDIIMQEAITILPEDTGGSLTEKMAILGAEVLKVTMQLLSTGVLPRIPQDSGHASYFPMIKKSMGNIEWNHSAIDLCNLVRAIDPWPGAFTSWNQKTLKIWSMQINKTEPILKAVPGQVLTANSKEGLIVAVGNGSIQIIEIQLPGKNRMLAKDFLVGHKIPIGTIFTRKEEFLIQ